MKHFKSNLLRRTAASFVAISGIFLVGDVQAQAVKLMFGGNTAECTGQTMVVKPNGTVEVTCTAAISSNTGTGGGGGVVVPTGPTSFSLSSTGGSLIADAVPSPALQLLRNGTTTGAYLVGYNVDGDGCTTKGNFSLSFADGNNTPKDITQVRMNSTGTRCTVTLGAARLPDGTYGNVNSGTTAAVYNKGTTNTPDPGTSTPPAGMPTPPAGCPAIPSNSVYETFGPVSSHNKWMTKPIGTIVVAQMPNVSSSLSTVSMIHMPSPLVNTPGSGDVEYSISKCPGEIKTDYSDFCNVTHDVSMYTQQWVSRATTQYPNKATANMYGLCWAPQSEGPYYLNLRYKFPQGCGYSAETCGVIWQYY